MSMSRSYRKNAVVTDQQSGSARVRQAKRLANRAVRVSDDVPSGKAYRKYSCSYDIRDWSSFNEKGKRK